MRTYVALAALLGSALGCAVVTPTQAAPTTSTSAGDEVRTPLAATGAIVAEGPPAPPAPPAPRCRVSVTDTHGCEPNQVEALVAPVRARLEKCRGPKGGKLSIRVRQSPTGKLGFDVESSSLDPTEKACVLDALNTIQIDPNSMAWMGPSVPPSGFTSLLTIEW